MVDLGRINLGQGDLVGTLQSFVHRDGSPSVCCIKVEVSRLQAEDLALTEREDHAHVHRQMQGGVLDGLQRRQHGALIPDGAFFGVDLGGFTGSRRFVNQIPVNGIRKGGLQERVDFVNGRAG